MPIPDKQFIEMLATISRGGCPVKAGYRATESQHLILRRLTFGVAVDMEMCLRHPTAAGNISRARYDSFLCWVKEVLPTMKPDSPVKKNLRERLRRYGEP